MNNRVIDPNKTAEQEKIYEKMKTDFFNLLIKPVRRIYIDMELLQDFNLGALITSLKSDAEYQYVLKNMYIYNLRYDNKICKHFPDLKRTEEDIQRILKDPKKQLQLNILSPFTVVYMKHLKEIFTLLNKVNINHTDFRSPIEIIINYSNINCDPTVLNTLKKSIEQMCVNLSVSFSNNKRYDYKEEFFKSIDVFMLYDYAEFFAPNTVSGTGAVKDGWFQDKQIIAAPLITNRNVTEDKYDESITKTQAILDVFSDFTYIPRDVCIV